MSRARRTWRPIGASVAQDVRGDRWTAASSKQAGQCRGWEGEGRCTGRWRAGAVAAWQSPDR
eukprot:583378-Prymnesium_polylepis.1